MSELEDQLAQLIRANHLPEPERHFRFAAAHVGPGRGLRQRLQAARLRDWEADFVWHDYGLLLEVEGGIWVGGRHTRGGGYESDVEKYNAATRLGWRVLRVTGKMIRDGRALALLREVLDDRPPAGTAGSDSGAA